MWLFSSKDPYAKIDRRKQLAEKRRITAKKRPGGVKTELNRGGNSKSNSSNFWTTLSQKGN